VLTIRGRSTSNDPAGYQRVYSEYSSGDHERAFTSWRTLTGNASRPRSRTGLCVSSSIRHRL
jgi:hypothetical protein